MCFSPLSILRTSFGRSCLEGQQEDHQRACGTWRHSPCSHPPANEALMLMAPPTRIPPNIQTQVSNFFVALRALSHPSCSPTSFPSSPSSTPNITPRVPVVSPVACYSPLVQPCIFFAADGLLLFPLSPSLICARVSSANRWVMLRNNTRF